MKLNVQFEADSDSELFEDLERYLRYHPRLTRFLLNPAGLTFAVGWVLYLGMIIGWFGIYLVDPEVARKSLVVVLTEFTAGREVAIPTGIIQLGIPVLLVAGISFTQDLISTTWIYPAFYLYRKRNVGRENFAGYFFKRMEQKAEEHRAFIERYGAVGLYFFMLIPFAVNGPLIGAIIGKLAGIRTRYILPTVILATATATAAWTIAWYYAADQVSAFVEQYGGGWIAAAMIGAFLLVLSGTFIGFVKDMLQFRREKRARADQAAADAAAAPREDPPADPPPKTSEPV